MILHDISRDEFFVPKKVQYRRLSVSTIAKEKKEKKMGKKYMIPEVGGHGVVMPTRSIPCACPHSGM